LRTIPLDFIFEHWRSGLSVLPIKEVIAERDRFREMWIPSPRHQFAYLLAKKTWKGKISAAQADRLRILAESLGRQKAEAITAKIFLGKWNERVVSACLDGTLAPTLERAHNFPWMTAVVRHPLMLCRHGWDQARRIWQRWLYPTGLLVAVLGPDGSGKDTVINGLSHEIERGFRRTAFYHWRPNLLLPAKAAVPITDPHAKAPRGPFLSSLYLMGFVLDYWIGYAIRIRHGLARGTLVVFDRYFYDVIVDPKRARFGGPRWFAILLARLVPSPDLTLVLDANENIMFARKGELSVDELRRQRLAYRELSVGITARKTVQTDQAIDRSVADATGALVDFLHKRFENRNAEWVRDLSLTDVHG
jgi:thymidylate kinase